jgi:hypothetical protein
MIIILYGGGGGLKNMILFRVVCHMMFMTIHNDPVLIEWI